MHDGGVTEAAFERPADQRPEGSGDARAVDDRARGGIPPYGPRIDVPKRIDEGHVTAVGLPPRHHVTDEPPPCAGLGC